MLDFLRTVYGVRMRWSAIFLVLAAMLLGAAQGKAQPLTREAETQPVAQEQEKKQREDTCSEEYLAKLAGINAAAGRRRELICEILIWDRWYRYWSYSYEIMWVSATILIVVLTALSSILAALDVANKRGGKAILVTLPAVAALLTTLVTQFGVRDLWKVREVGTLQIQGILIKARSLNGDEPNFREIVKQLRIEVLDVDKEQASQFFQFIGKTDDKARD